MFPPHESLRTGKTRLVARDVILGLEPHLELTFGKSGVNIAYQAFGIQLPGVQLLAVEAETGGVCITQFTAGELCAVKALVHIKIGLAAVIGVNAYPDGYLVIAYYPAYPCFAARKLFPQFLIMGDINAEAVAVAAAGETARFLNEIVYTSAYLFEYHVPVSPAVKLVHDTETVYIEYKGILIARKEATVSDIALKTSLAPGIGRYMMGLGEKGGFCPDNLRWKWDVEKNQDGPWVGDVNAGIQIRFYDNKYERPLNTNFYHQKPLIMPASWCNGGHGGIDITGSGNGGTLINAYSGNRQVKKGENLYYYFNVAVTPFRPIDTDKQWRERYFHSYDFLENVSKVGATVLNIHHATGINPFINYPFLRPQEMKAYIDGAHARGMKVKIYDTVRELTNSCVEIFALRSLGDEIFSQGPGGGYSWLQEHYDQDYIGAWFVYSLKDAAIVNTGVSRWHNYYLEGLDWLVRNVGIDGVYIDDLAFDRMTMKRIRKILDRANPGALIDLHSANQYNTRDGFANSANLYLEHFPYLDRLWFGEYFNYDFPPEFWLVEVSGIPYGLMGEMLEGGGNPWRGMLYGMTGRSPRVNNGPLWKLWDSFGMAGSEMIGYWVKDNPVKTGSDKTLATIYRRTGERTLISIATWEDSDATVSLSIDWNALGLDPSKVTLHAPEIENFQPEATWKPGDRITVPKGKGLLIVAGE